MKQSEMDTLVSTILSELRADNAAVFVGAGLSRGAGYVDWAGLLKPLASELGLNIDEEVDLVAVAQYFLNSENQQRHRLTCRGEERASTKKTVSFLF